MGKSTEIYIYIFSFLGKYILLTILRTLRLGTTELCDQGKKSGFTKVTGTV